LISLAYLTVYLVTGELNWFKGLKSSDPKIFEKVKRIKNKMTPKSLCVERAVDLEPFVHEIFNYQFEDTPNYPKLKHQLVGFLLQR
jgi:hypothetical protein